MFKDYIDWLYEAVLIIALGFFIVFTFAYLGVLLTGATIILTALVTWEFVPERVSSLFRRNGVTSEKEERKRW